MIKNLLLPCAFLMLGSQGAEAQSSSLPISSQAERLAIQDRIDRVERGLTTPVVIRGAPDQTMPLIDRMAFHRVPAVSIALINNGQVEWARAYGMADATGDRPATVNTLFQAGSISKSITAIGAMRLTEQGKLVLDEDANSQLASWKIPENEFTRSRTVTLRMLLNHTAGTTVHGFNGYAQSQAAPTLEQTLDGIAPANSEPVRVDVVPGSAWRYSGGGYEIVQLMMTEAAEVPFERYIQTQVFDPLGMSESTFAPQLPPLARTHAATAYESDGRAVPGQWRSYPESAAAGLWSTPSDLARIVIAVQEAEAGVSGSILSPSLASQMLTPGLGQYGLGFYVEDLGDRTSFSHSGGTQGFRSQLYGYTQSGQGVVVMTNSENGAALIAEILGSIAQEYGWPEFQAVEKVAMLGDATLNDQYAGDYLLLDQPVHITAEGDRLYFQSDLFGARPMEMFVESPVVFFMTAQDMSIRFERGDEGSVTGFRLFRGANVYTGARSQ